MSRVTVGSKWQVVRNGRLTSTAWQGVDSRIGDTTGGNHAGVVLVRKAQRIGAQALAESSMRL